VIRLVVVFTVLALLGAARAAPLSVTTESVDLDSENPQIDRVGALRYVGGIVVRSADERFGGLSGAVVDDDGRMIAVSDRGYWFEARLVYDGGGRLTGLAQTTYSAMRNETGGTVQANWLTGDAEAVQRDGTDLLVAFERRHRIWRYDGRGDLATARPKPVPLPPAVAKLPRNGGIEAMARLGPNRILAVGEEPLGGSDDSPTNTGWIVGPEGTTEVHYPNTPWRPTDFALLPNGDLLALERRFYALAGFAARIKRIPANRLAGGATLDGEVIARLEPPMLSDNFEGLAVRRDRDGRTRVILVSDDNFRFLQRTLILEFVLED